MNRAALIVPSILGIGSLAAHAQDPRPYENLRLVASYTSSRDASAMAFSPDQHYLAVARKGNVTVLDGKGQVYFTRSLRDAAAVENNDDPLRRAEVNDLVPTRLLFSPDSRTLAVACFGSDVNLFDMGTPRDAGKVFGNAAGGARCLAFSPDSKVLVTGGNDKLVALWDVASLKRLRSFEGHFHNVVAVAFNKTGDTIVSLGCQSGGRDNGEVKFWDAATGTLNDERSVGEVDPRTAILSQDGRIIASCDPHPLNLNNAYSVGFWNSATGEHVRTAEQGYSNVVNSTLWLSPDNEIVTAISNEVPKGGAAPTAALDLRGDLPCSIVGGLLSRALRLSGAVFALPLALPATACGRSFPFAIPVENFGLVGGVKLFVSGPVPFGNLVATGGAIRTSVREHVLPVGLAISFLTVVSLGAVCLLILAVSLALALLARGIESVFPSLVF